MSLTVLVRGVGVENLKRARQALESLAGALSSRATDSLRVSVMSALPESPFNLARVAGTALTGRDWSSDFARLQNFDVALSSRASESTLSAIAGALATRATDKLRVSVVDVLPESPFNLARVGGVVLTGRDWSADFARLQNLDIPLSSRASEATLAGIRAQIDKLTFDASNRLKVNVEAIANPPNLDVQLSSFTGVPDQSPPGRGVVLLGFDGTYLRRVRVTSDGRLLATLG